MSIRSTDHPAELSVRFREPGRRFDSPSGECPSVSGNRPVGDRSGGHQFSPSKTSPMGGVAAAFLDRDGVINNSGDYVNSVEDFALLRGVAAAIRRLNNAGIPVVVVTNQGGVALEYISRDDLEAIHDRMEELLAEETAHVDAVYASLTIPNGTVPELAKESRYRKPAPGMIEQARDDLGIDPHRSYMVGDTPTDILAGEQAGCLTLLVRTGFGGGSGREQAEPTVVVDDLSAAVDWILTDIAARI